MAAMSAALKTWVKRWRASRSPRLADAIERLGREDDSDGVGAQLAALSKGKSVEHFKAAAAGVAKLDDDPRLTVVVIQWLNAARAPGSSAAGAWAQVFQTLVRLRDARAIAPLRSVAARAPEFLGAKHTAWIQEQATATAAALEAATAQLEPESAADAKALAALEAELTVPQAAWFARPGSGSSSGIVELLKRVWAAPEDDALKQVVADALLERDDSWGELINLQCSDHAAAAGRVQELIRTIGATVCGPIAKIAGLGHRVYAKGFLVGCHADASMRPRRDWEEAASAPHWATVRRVALCTAMPKWWPAALLANPATRWLREIAICHYHAPMIIVARPAHAAPWVVTGPVPANGALWFKILTDVALALPPSERVAIQIGAMPAAVPARAALAEADARSSPIPKRA